MAQINGNYNKLAGNYLFAEIGRRVAEYQKANPDKKLIRLGIGDVTLPLAGAVVDAMHEAVAEMGKAETFQGYPPATGYDFLLNAIAEGDYKARGIDISPNEIIVSDGAKTDTGNIGDIFGPDNKVALGDPVYPVYLDTNVMAGRAGEPLEGGMYSDIIYMPCAKENGFLPEIPAQKADLVYLCFPNNPTGMVAGRDYLAKWVDYANKNDAVILYDGAYEAFVREEGIPRSIFEIPGARTCAIEFRSFSKTAGFTGVRCGYTVIPRELARQGKSLLELWQRRQSTKFNGVPYVTQRAAAAVYTERGRRETGANIEYYLANAKLIHDGLARAGLTVYGGVNAPYIWAETPGGLGSWAFFSRLLEEANVVTTPGVGFGPSGEGYIRLTAFGNREATQEAVARIQKAAAGW